ncbi:MAG: FAD-binding protein [Sedimentisphaerales bacterium]|nr:FAD-binding protein [Sedimentisphaerales bacterium]
METEKIAGQKVTVHYYNTVIVGAGAAGMNCTVHLYEFMEQKGISNPQDRITVITAGIPLGASRMSGSDKQTYYKMGTAPETADSAVEFAKSLTAAGCCHEDLALAEAIGSLREFYHLIQVGVPFPHDPMGSYIGYKTDHDPYERATSAGPKTSKFMSECLEKQVRAYGIKIHDHMEVAELLFKGTGNDTRITGVAALYKKDITAENFGLHIFCCRNLVLAAGGPGELYETSVYPKGQLGIHGVAFRAGLAAENLTESQFGLASTKFRWNVSGTYMQAIPRIYSTDANGRDGRDFLPDFFDSMSKMATNIFLKGYQWPFDPQRIENQQSSLIDVLVFNETQKGRRIFMDFLHNPVGNKKMKSFALEDLENEALTYLQHTGAMQKLPIQRLEHMNPPAIEIYTENGIDLYNEPLEIAVCAQHNNGGFAVDKWWQSNIPGIFVIGEMAGTHGIKRPGGSALNSGQTGGLRAAEFIVHRRSIEIAEKVNFHQQITELITKWKQITQSNQGIRPQDAITQIQSRMTAFAGHIRRSNPTQKAIEEALRLYRQLVSGQIKIDYPKSLITAVQAEHLSLTSIAYLKAILELLTAGSGSRGSHLVATDDGIPIHPDVMDIETGKPLRFKPENVALRDSVIQIKYDPDSSHLFRCALMPVRRDIRKTKAFEPAWQDYREGIIYDL